MGITAASRVEDRAALVRAVERIVRDYPQPAVVEAFLEGPEFTVTVVGNAPPRALAVLQRALEETSGIGILAELQDRPVHERVAEVLDLGLVRLGLA